MKTKYIIKIKSFGTNYKWESFGEHKNKRLAQDMIDHLSAWTLADFEGNYPEFKIVKRTKR